VRRLELAGKAIDALRHDRPTVRFIASSGERPRLPATIRVEEKTAGLPHGPCAVVATTAKWGMVDLGHPFDLLLIDEAWQMPWANLMLLGQVAARFILIGDPGQIPPVVAIQTARWGTADKPPHLPAPEVIQRDPELRERAIHLELPASRRLPHDTVELIQPFYEFPFHSWTGPGERAIEAERGGRDPLDQVIDLLRAGTVAAATLPTPDGGPPLEKDDALARLAARLVTRFLEREAVHRDDAGVIVLQPEQIGITATHRVMNTAIHLALPTSLQSRVVVDTPERWQGLERQLMIAVHPLSGVLRPSEFDLETGRLCVMASRHRGGLVLLGRDHIGETLAQTIPSAAQGIGRRDVAGRGHAVHSGLWERLWREDRVVAA
jgi:hypothetical protein